MRRMVRVLRSSSASVVAWWGMQMAAPAFMSSSSTLALASSDSCEPSTLRKGVVMIVSFRPTRSSAFRIAAHIFSCHDGPMIASTPAAMKTSRMSTTFSTVISSLMNLSLALLVWE